MAAAGPEALKRQRQIPEEVGTHEHRLEQLINEGPRRGPAVGVARRRLACRRMPLALANRAGARPASEDETVASAVPAP